MRIGLTFVPSEVRFTWLDWLEDLPVASVLDSVLSALSDTLLFRKLLASTVSLSVSPLRTGIPQLELLPWPLLLSSSLPSSLP